MENNNITAQATGQENVPAFWYAVHAIGCKELEVKDYFEQQGLGCFVPMVYTDTGRGGKPMPRHFVPAVHNLLFLQTEYPQKRLAGMVRECPFPLYIYTRTGTMEYSRISNNEMSEIRLLCDPDYELTQYIAPEEAEAKVGKEVRIVKGPFAGATGKLVRIKKGYYFIKTTFQLGVMIRISRWYCTPL